MKTLRIYLREKYGFDATTISRAEAVMLGIGYPPERGWLRRFGDMDITPETEAALKSVIALPTREQRNAAARALVNAPRATSPLLVHDGAGFYESVAWRRARYAAIKRSKGICSCCGAKPSRGKPLHVDHIKPRSKFPELALQASNLQVLCADCNAGKSNSDTTDWRGHADR